GAIDQEGLGFFTLKRRAPGSSHVALISRGTVKGDMESWVNNLGECSGSRIFDRKHEMILSMIEEALKGCKQTTVVGLYGHSQGGSLSQLILSAMAQKILDAPNRSPWDKKFTFDMAVWNSPGVTAESAEEFKKRVLEINDKQISSHFDLTYCKVDYD